MNYQSRAWIPELKYCKAMTVTSFGMAETFCMGFDYYLWRMIRSGDFDRVLLRPRSMFIQIAGSYFHNQRMARVISGSGAIIWCLWKLGVQPTFINLLTILLALL